MKLWGSGAHTDLEGGRGLVLGACFQRVKMRRRDNSGKGVREVGEGKHHDMQFGHGADFMRNSQPMR